MSDIAFCLLGGVDPFGTEAFYCVKSVHRQYPSADIFVGIPETESQSKPLPNYTTPVSVETPIPDYPMSLKPVIVKKATRKTSASTVCFLDSDTIMCSQLALPEDGDIFALPELFPDQHIGGRGAEAWGPLYDRVRYKYPDRRINSIYYNDDIWPNYNAGVIIFRELDIADEWLVLLKKLINHVPNRRFTDQVSLSILSTKYNTQPLTVRQHCPVPLSIIVPPSATILHYWGGPEELYKAPFHWNYLSQIGRFERSSFVQFYQIKDMAETLLNRTRFYLGHKPGWVD